MSAIRLRKASRALAIFSESAGGGIISADCWGSWAGDVRAGAAFFTFGGLAGLTGGADCATGGVCIAGGGAVRCGATVAGGRVTGAIGWLRTAGAAVFGAGAGG